MGEIDQVLARVYAARDPGGVDRSGVDRGFDHAPHFRPPKSIETRDESQAIAWPATVEALERSHGDRFEKLADMLIDQSRSGRAKVTLFTSCRRAEGRTTLVLTLAKALAAKPVRSLLVDADLGGPMLARRLGLTPRYGLEDVVESGIAASSAWIDTKGERLSILPLRGPAASPREFLASPAWSCLMARLRREFDLVLLDGGPLFVGLSAAALHRSVDAAILVQHQGVTSDRSINRAREVLDAAGIPLLGMAETFV